MIYGRLPSNISLTYKLAPAGTKLGTAHPQHICIAKLSPSSTFSWAELALFSLYYSIATVTSSIATVTSSLATVSFSIATVTYSIATVTSKQVQIGPN